MILMPKLLHFLHNSPVMIPLKTFRIANTIFRTLIWKNCPPRIKLEHLQHPKDEGGLVFPNHWLYYLALQLQHLIGTFHGSKEQLVMGCSSSDAVMLHTVNGGSIPMAVEAQAFVKPHKTIPTYN